MSLAIGNKTNNLTAGTGQTQITFSHNQDVGADGHLILMIAHPTANVLTGVKYNGTSMSLLSSFTTTSTGDYWSIWELDDPDTGSNNVELTFSAACWNPTSSQAVSFTGCSGTGAYGYTDTGGPPQTKAITVAENSVIMAGGISGAIGTDVTIDGSSRTIDYNNYIYNYHWGGVSALGLSAGSVTSSVDSSAGAAIHVVELQEASAPASRRVFLIT